MRAERQARRGDEDDGRLWFGALLEDVAAEWHVDSNRIMDEWSEERFWLMVERLGERREAARRARQEGA